MCGGPKREWQVFCGAACCAEWEAERRRPPRPEEITPVRVVDRDELLAEWADTVQGPERDGGA